MLHHNLHGRTVQYIKVTLQPIHRLIQHHLREVIADNHVLVMLRRRIAPDPRSPKKFLKAMRLTPIVVMGEHRDQQALTKTPRTQEYRSLITLQVRDKLSFIHIIKATFAHLRKISHGIGNGYLRYHRIFLSF